MRKLVFIILTGLVFTNLAAQGIKYPIMATEKDSVSFFIGIDVAMSVKGAGVELNGDMLAKGVLAGLAAGDDYDSQNHVEFLKEYFTVRIPQKKLAESEAYLESIAADPKIQRTESGLLYEIIEPGDMNFRALQDDDSVEVIYTGSLPDGTIFDSNDEGVVLPLNRVIRGWTEGLKLVGKGGRIMLYIHPEMGYGPQGSRNVIPPNSALVFDVTVLDAPEAY